MRQLIVIVNELTDQYNKQKGNHTIHDTAQVLLPSE